MDFDKRKSAAIASLQSAIVDKSPKGSVDEPVIPLLRTVNSHSSFYTTSSCSGRISVLSTPAASSVKKKAGGGTWLFISHDVADAEHVVSLLFGNREWRNPGNELVFRFEPFILAVECRDVAEAGKLVALAIRCGFRESGITSLGRKRDRIIVGIRCSIRMEVPLGVEGRVLVGEEYVRFLVTVANGKMESNRRRYELFQMAFIEEMAPPDVDEDSAKSEGPSVSGAIVERLTTSGEYREKLFLWGHSSCPLIYEDRPYVFVFGGFGGKGRHARRNDSLLLDPQSGLLSTIDVEGKLPTARLGHSASVVGDCVYVIGGRADPLSILNDVWVFNIEKKKWVLPQCNGSYFNPRHRHAAAVIGSNIYVHGGLNNDSVLSSMFILDTKNLIWKELSVAGEQPCARHSHSMVAHDMKLFIFGGYNGDIVLGDLYSFDVLENVWNEVQTFGKIPRAKFSHSMFAYGNLLGLIGGCPLGQEFQELAILDIRRRMWTCVTLNFIGEELLVRSTTSVVGDDLFVIGGGAACYAFGTKFSDPLKISLLPLLSVRKKGPRIFEASNEVQHEKIGRSDADPSLWVLELERKHAKLGKDILRKFRWLDDGRKVYSKSDGNYICFPVTKSFAVCFSHKKEAPPVSTTENPFNAETNSLCLLSAIDLLKEHGSRIISDDVAEVRNRAKSHSQRMRESIISLIKSKGLPEDRCLHLPSRWERLGDMIVFPVSSFKNPLLEAIGDELWRTIASSLNCSRLARQGRVASTATRDSTLELLLGNDGWVDHVENGIVYSFDATKCMFSWGNLSEKLRISKLDCENEVVVDLFAGIGYFVLPFLVRAKAKLVYACEWNPHAIDALKRNLEKNVVMDRCVVLEGDNRITAPKDVADRVCLGLLPTSEGSWLTAVRALKNLGGVLHIHGNVKDTEEAQWAQRILHSVAQLARQEGRSWTVSVVHVERVKWYAPHVLHLVADVTCRQVPR